MKKILIHMLATGAITSYASKGEHGVNNVEKPWTPTFDFRYTGIKNVALYANWEIGLDIFIGDVAELGPERMAIRPVTARLAGDAAKADLKHQEPIDVTKGYRILPIHLSSLRKHISQD